jgi:uncharacterized protein YjiS (DUF1127 family)
MTYAPTDVKRVGNSGQPSPFLETLNGISSYFGELLEARRGRRELVRLASFDDDMLADIGVVRSDIEWALMQPWNGDPSLELAMRVNRRKESVNWARTFWAR